MVIICRFTKVGMFLFYPVKGFFGCGRQSMVVQTLCGGEQAILLGGSFRCINYLDQIVYHPLGNVVMKKECSRPEECCVFTWGM